MSFAVENLRARLGNARARSKLSKAELARRTGLAVYLIRDYEAGRRAPTIRSLCLLAEALHLTPDDLLKGYGSP